MSKQRSISNRLCPTTLHLHTKKHTISKKMRKSFQQTNKTEDRANVANLHRFCVVFTYYFRANFAVVKRNKKLMNELRCGIAAKGVRHLTVLLSVAVTVQVKR